MRKSSTKQIIKKRFEEEVAEMVESEYEFSCWLDDNFDIAEIWKATEADRLEIRNNWKEFCEALVRNNSTYDYKEVEIEI